MWLFKNVYNNIIKVNLIYHTEIFYMKKTATDFDTNTYLVF